jgi:DNA-binding NtrC family response regulator
MRAASGTSHAPGTAIAGDLEAMLELVGRVPMKDLVRDTTDAIEKMCIEAALGLTGNNRAAAARVLGLSRQALYLKLERHGIGDA